MVHLPNQQSSAYCWKKFLSKKLEKSEKELKIREEELTLKTREVENENGFFTTTITTNTGYDGVVIKTCEKVITNSPTQMTMH